MLGPEPVTQVVDQVTVTREHIRTIKNLPKQWTDQHKRSLGFELEDRLDIKISPIKRVIGFDKKGKFSPEYIKQFEILKRIEDLAYKMNLLLEMKVMSGIFMYLSFLVAGNRAVDCQILS